MSGRFELYFEPQGSQMHTLELIRYFMRPSILPLESRSLFFTDTCTIDPPFPWLLAIHAAIAHILYLNAAGSYIDSILEDLDSGDISVDGSTPLGHLSALRIHGCWDRRLRVC